MKKIFIFFVLCILAFVILNFTPAKQSAYTNDAEARMESFKKEIALVVSELQGAAIDSWQENGRVRRGLLVNIKTEHGDKESLMASLKKKLVEKNFVERKSFFCKELEYIDFSSENLDGKNIILHWHYPDDRCQSK